MLVTDVFTEGLAFQDSSAVVAHFVDVVPGLSLAEVHTAAERGMLVSALRLGEQLGKLRQADPGGDLTAAVAGWAGGMAGVWPAVYIQRFSYG
jgi:hypothetical protein